MNVKGKVCVVTGAASGIGEAVARAYAEAGARGVVVADLKTTRDRLAKVAGDIDGLPITADVGLEEDIKALIAAAEDKYGPVDVFLSLIHISEPTRLLSISYAVFCLKKKKKKQNKIRSKCM